MSLRTDNLVIPQGTTWSARWPIYGGDLKLADLTGWSVRSQVRSKSDLSIILHEWSTALGNASASPLGYVEITVSPTESTAWTWIYDRPVYDIEVTDPDGNVMRLTQGKITVSPEITK